MGRAAAISLLMLALFAARAARAGLRSSEPPPDEMRYYADADAALGPTRHGTTRVVFLGDSIVERWKLSDYIDAPRCQLVNRGKGGDRASDLLARFAQDAAALKPSIIVLGAGTNDALDDEPASQIIANMRELIDRARGQGMRVLVGDVIPMRPDRAAGREPVAQQLNAWERKYCAAGACVLLDYAAAVDRGRGFEQRYYLDDLHPNDAGYRLMAPVLVKGLATAGVKARDRAPSAP